MDWRKVGGRIRKQREYMGYTREHFAELLDITPKFCSDIELGVKGMSVPTLCKISKILRLTTDYILFGTMEQASDDALLLLLRGCSTSERSYAEQLLKTFLMAMTEKGDSL
jgi:transcriptional regulator with XRE-family HTH domain